MSDDIKEKIIKEAKKIEVDSLYSSKGQYEAASFWSKVHLYIGIPAAILAAIAGASALSQFDYSNIIAGILAIVVAALTAVTTFLNPNEKANSHHNAGINYNSLKTRTRIFHEIDCNCDLSIKDLTEELQELVKERDTLNQESPQISRRAYERAKKGIQAGEANYKSC